MDSIWLQWSKFEACVSFLLIRGGFSHVTINTHLGLTPEQVSQTLKYHQEHRNEVRTYQIIPWKARKNLLESNHQFLKDYAPKYHIEVDVYTLDDFLLRLGILEDQLEYHPITTLGKVFHQEITPEQIRDLQQGRWITNYRQIHHVYRKWFEYGQKAFILIKQSPTYFQFFSHYLRTLSID